jgi:hypothetical protein
MTPLPHINKVKQGVQLGELQAWQFAEDKQPQAAVNALLASLACAQSLKFEPVLVSQLVRASSLAIEKEALERVINSLALAAPDLERLATAFAKAESEEAAGAPFTRASVGERVLTLSNLDLPPEQLSALLTKNSTPGESAPGNVQAAAVKELTRDIKPQRAFAEETFNHALVLRKQPLPERLKADEYFVARVAAANTNHFMLIQLFLPALGRQTSREATGLAQLRLAQAAIALERYRLANGGHYPATLDELTPSCIAAVPRDPFDGQPLRYNRSGAGYELNSVGADSAKPIKFTVVNAPKAIALAR